MTARIAAGSFSRDKRMQALACSSVLTLGVERPNDAGHLKRCPSDSTNTQDAGSLLLVLPPDKTVTVADEQVAELT